MKYSMQNVLTFDIVVAYLTHIKCINLSFVDKSLNLITVNSSLLIILSFLEMFKIDLRYLVWKALN